ncbi:uncharacterized protein LOC130825005 [Amaranthus tricolor]|uniref:uncharacterized protein LOC130825005 n=1 Tax=Amaranthus tricolor TaxID=29722 RepID=UPI00258AB06D|nr:uncharacterized protein LOC130825005 [Amaranthus tricolor]
MTPTRSSRLETEDEHRRRVLEDAVIALANRDNCQRQGQAAFDKVLQMRPPSYSGTTDPVILEGWIRTMEKVFRAARCPEEEKLDIGAYYLEGEADNWWTMLHPQCTADSNFKWSQFLEKLRERFYPAALRWRKQDEFMNLFQGNMTIQEYTDKFTELSRFAPHACPTEAEKVLRYVNRMDPRVQIPVMSSKPATFQEAYDIALSIHTTILENEARMRNAKPPPQHVDPRKCNRCSKNSHPGVTCEGKPIVCYRCQEQGHKSYECPKRSGVTESGAARLTSPATQKSRVFCMTREEANANPDVVTGNILVLNKPAVVLFDSGATMSFISSSFVNKVGLLPTSPVNIIITLPTGEEVMSGREYKNVPIKIAESIFLADLKHFPMTEFDVILGMDWLYRYQVIIYCHDKRIVMKDHEGKEISYSGVNGKKGVRIVSALKMMRLLRKGEMVFLCSVKDVSEERKLEDIPVVREYPDVFPNELPGIPPERDVEFSIDVIPGTAPISKAPYRMAPPELQELKTALCKEKGR